jgi:hypothetical protein
MNYEFIQDDDTKSPFDSNKLGKATKFAAAGFTALTGLLTYLGIQGGILDRIIAKDVTATLWVFLCIGGGLVAALLSATLRPEPTVPFWLVVVAVSIPLASTRFLVKPLRPGITFPTVVYFCGILLLLIFAIALDIQGRRIQLTAGLVILAVFSTCIGLYSGVKVAVRGKSEISTHSVQAALEPDGPRYALRVEVKGSHIDRAYRLEVHGISSRTGAVNASEKGNLGVATLIPGEDGVIDQPLHFPVEPDRWGGFSVWLCKAKVCEPAHEEVRLLGRRSGSKARPNGNIVTAGKKLRLIYTASGLNEGEKAFINVGVGPRTKPHSILTARLFPDATGSITWQATLPRAKKGQWLMLRGRVCAPCTPLKMLAERKTY